MSLSTAFEIRAQHPGCCTWLCNDHDLALEELIPAFKGPGWYVDQSWNVLKVYKWKTPAIKKEPAYSFAVVYVYIHRIEVCGCDWVLDSEDHWK